jgi:hypothetical protein
MSYDSIANRGDYLSPHYLAEVLPRDLRKSGGLRARWAEREKAKDRTPVRGLRELRRTYFDARAALAAFAQKRDEEKRVPEDEQREHDKSLQELNGAVLRALGFAAEPHELGVERSGSSYPVSVAYAARSVVAVDCGWATDTDAALDADLAGRLIGPVETGDREPIETGSRLARWLFAADEPPRYVLLLHGGVIVLADRATWGEGRYLAVSLDVAIERADQQELETIAALFSADALQPPAEGGAEPLAGWVDSSRQHAVGVSGELREGLRESVQIIANEVLDRIRDQEVAAEQVMEPAALARELGRESLRYLYRVLFLLYAEARPELGILPVDDEDYMAGYSMARLGDLVARRLGGEEARTGFHLHESLDVLFRMVNNGHRARGTATAAGLSEGEGIRFEALKADLFDPAKTRLIGREAIVRPGDDEDDPAAPRVDTRLRDAALYQVLRRLMLAKGRGRGRGRSGRAERGGFISYAQLGIGQLGAVYEGLMSYTGFIASEELYEVAKGGDPSGGSWMIPASKADGYGDDVFVMEKDDNGFRTGARVRYRPGSFVYRLAGRDRQVSASYYTPQSLTSVTVQLALDQRVKEEGRPVTADEVLRWRVCEPALGSGAFLNEAINQLAALYLRLREAETRERLEPDARAAELQKVKAYIALHNCYGVDLNETAVELAEVSIWLNVMHRGLQAPWFGLHLVRGNSLIGAGRRLYPPNKLAKGAWLDAAPLDQPFSSGEIPAGHIHHFLLPASGWGAVAAEREAKELAPEQTARLAAWRKQIRKAPSEKRARGQRLSQVQRLQALAGRAEYLWSLVIERLRISEREISRPIDVWGAADLPTPQESIPRDKVLAALTLQGTPYWRLKTVMDAWCALWFWPIDKAGLLDGSDEAYQRETPPEPPPVEPAAEPDEPPAFAGFPQRWEQPSLLGESPKQLGLDEVRPSPRRLRPKTPAVEHRSPVPLADLDDWLEFAEALLGRQDIPADSLAATFTSLHDLDNHEDRLDTQFFMDMDPVHRLGQRFPWLDTVEDIARGHGFFHWELRFAWVFANGGFDLQVGNPPWVRPRWEANPVLAELDPWFELAARPTAQEHERRMKEVLTAPSGQTFYLGERTEQVATDVFFSSAATFELLVGTQPDFYRVFMVRVWFNIGQCGVAGLIHPDTHMAGTHEGRLRRSAYRHLRVHAHFQNRRLIFPDVDWNKQFGVHVYASDNDVNFTHLSWLFDPDSLIPSLSHDGSGEAPGIKYDRTWDLRPHGKRLVQVDDEALNHWRLLSGDLDTPLEEVKLRYPVSTEEQSAITALSEVEYRLSDLNAQITRGYDEASAKKAGLIQWATSGSTDWAEVILRGPQINIATPIAKEPPNTKHTDKPVDLVALSDSAVPSTDYRRAVPVEQYQNAQDQWFSIEKFRELLASSAKVADAKRKVAAVQGRNPKDITDMEAEPYLRQAAMSRYTEFYRVAWREMIPASTERSLFPAVIPPGPAHIHGVRSMALVSNRATALVAGFWATVPLDYAVRIGGRGHLDVAEARAMPVPDLDHPLSGALLLRTLRLNCLTSLRVSRQLGDTGLRYEEVPCL